ncbi:ankyrin repeat domain-containing protein [Plantactinospora sonchi]|uniref:Ankyrin repeat domain-containing protein n=1 Tax=Plantactinospora sonchi TaxID=1544735 RepID=A0ABU7RL42_9ACTN
MSASDFTRPSSRLPERPHIEQLRRQAAELQRRYASGAPDAVALVTTELPDRPAPSAARLPRSVALLVVARRYGFASWPRLKRHVELVTRYTRIPDQVPPSAEPAPEFLRLACLTYTDDDGPHQWEQARRLLRGYPGIPDSSVHAAAAVADPARVRRFLADDPDTAGADGGPYRWPPLLYLAYARHDPDVPERAVLDTARLLLSYGADPDAGYLWHGLPTPFTVLTGAFGEGEQGPTRQPRHPHQLALARLLLDAGADPNDGQALYNRMFGPDDSHLTLLFRYGLGGGDGGPWRARLGDAVDSPAGLLRRQLRHAVTHGLPDRVRRLAAHGVDLDSPFADGRTAGELAALHGHPEIAGFLASHGAAGPALAGIDAVVAALLTADRAALDRLRAADPHAVDVTRAARPDLVRRATAAGRAEAVPLLVELGFDVDAAGPAAQTALHTAVAADNPALVRLLLSLGAEPTRRDGRFDATPLDWARHLGHQDLVRLLTPLTGE